jgi:pyruvate ferredoxin oxidoreductase gamma subunit
VIVRPDLVVVADEGLVPVASAGVVAGVDEGCVLLINSALGGEAWRERLSLPGPIFTLAAEAEAVAELRLLGVSCAGAAARCLGIVTRASLESAIREELAASGERGVSASLERALAAWEALADAEGCVRESPDLEALTARPAWVDLALEGSEVSAPDIHGGATSVEVRTGLWRTVRPVIDYEHCNRCSWICATFCPDSAISTDPDRTHRIDYDHCKGCMICAAVCPPHAIGAVSERAAQAEDEEAGRDEAKLGDPPASEVAP